MACRTVATGPGFTAIFCGGRGREARCTGCGAPADHLCDYPIKPRTGDRKDPTCDRKLCGRCLVLQADGKEFCPPHDRLAKARQETKP